METFSDDVNLIHVNQSLPGENNCENATIRDHNVHLMMKTSRLPSALEILLEGGFCKSTFLSHPRGCWLAGGGAAKQQPDGLSPGPQGLGTHCPLSAYPVRLCRPGQLAIASGPPGWNCSQLLSSRKVLSVAGSRLTPPCSQHGQRPG